MVVDIGCSSAIVAPVKYTQTIELNRQVSGVATSQLHSLLDTTAGVTGCHIKRKNGPKHTCPPNCPAPLIPMDVTSWSHLMNSPFGECITLRISSDKGDILSHF